MRSNQGFLSQAFQHLKKPAFAIIALSALQQVLQEVAAEKTLVSEKLPPPTKSPIIPELIQPTFLTDPVPLKPAVVHDSQHTHLGNAIKRDDVAEISSILEKDARSLHVLTGPYKVHPWFYAIAEGKINTIKFLYENRDKYHLNVFMVGSQKFPNSQFVVKDSTSLGHACIFGQLPVIKFFYDKGFFSREVNGLNEAATCIVNAIASNVGPKVIPQLSSWGVDINTTMTIPTHSMMGKKPIPPVIYDPIVGLQLLLTHGLNPHLTWENQTLLEKAVSIGDAEAVDLLLKHNADLKNATVARLEQGVATMQTSVNFFKYRAVQCGRMPVRLCKGVLESEENRKLKNNLVALGKLFNYGVDYTQCNEFGQDIIYQITKIIKEQLPFRDHPAKDNGFSQFVFNEYVKAFFPPDLLNKITKRLVTEEEIESETTACQAQSQQTHARTTRAKLELINTLLLSLGGLVFSLAAFHFRENIINIPRRLIEYCNRPPKPPLPVQTIAAAKIRELEEKPKVKKPKKPKTKMAAQPPNSTMCSEAVSLSDSKSAVIVTPSDISNEEKEMNSTPKPKKRVRSKHFIRARNESRSPKTPTPPLDESTSTATPLSESQHSLFHSPMPFLLPSLNEEFSVYSNDNPFNPFQKKLDRKQ